MLSLVLAALLGSSWAPAEVAQGTLDVPVRMEILVVSTETPTARASGLAWTRESDGTLRGRAHGPGWDATVEVSREDAGARTLSLQLRWEKATGLRSAALKLGFAGSGRAVATDLAFTAVSRARRVGRGTPIVAQAGRLVLLGGEGYEAARYEESSDGLEATLFLDDASDRPFSTYDTCLEKLPEPAEPGGRIKFASLEKRTPVIEVPRRNGDVDRASAVVQALSLGTPFLPVIKERWPKGARAAVVFTDHADRTDAPALRALLWGTSDPRSAPTGGFFGHGLRITKSFFVRGTAGSLVNPTVAALAREIVAAGSEVAIHSITPSRDDQASVAVGLALASPYHPVTWIDHQPYTNCEAIASSGWRTDPPFGIRDILIKAGVRWVWDAGDVGGFGVVRTAGQPARRAQVIDLFAGQKESRPAIFPLPPDGRLWAFRSTFFYAPPGDLAAALSGDELLDLERHRGLFVAHTYLAAGPAHTHEIDHLQNLVVHAQPDGTLVIDPVFDAALKKLGERVSAGSIASLTWAQAGDRLLALSKVEVQYLPDGSALLTNRGEETLEGLTLAFPGEGLEIKGDGVVLPHVDEPGVTRVFLDLPAGSRVLLRASRSVDSVPFIVPP